MKYRDIYIEKVMPTVDNGSIPARVRCGDNVPVEAVIYSTAHQFLRARVVIRSGSGKIISRTEMKYTGMNDVFRTTVQLPKRGSHSMTINAWIDRTTTIIRGILSWLEAGESVDSDLLELKQRISQMESKARGRNRKAFREMWKIVNLKKPEKEKLALIPETFSFILDKYDKKESETNSTKFWLEVMGDELSKSWYEVFPRSQPPEGKKSGTFRDLAARLDYISEMGFDVVYLPPIHPIGQTNRRGKNGIIPCTKDDPGSPWAVGSEKGGFKSIAPELGTLDDFKFLIREARSKNMEIALDMAFQCSPDHPYVREHPEWFYRRPDGTIRYAENPPKKYFDIYPFNFYCENRDELWEELKSVVMYWAEVGVRMFRVDNPHTKPVGFWEWMIQSVRKEYPDTVFLSESFTTQNLMYRLSKAGFQLSYSYFTWKNFDWEIRDYFTELNSPEVSAFFTPVLFTNTPDILSYTLQHGGRAQFIIRAILAATLSSSWGIYSGYEICEDTPIPGREEYLDSEKYEIKTRDFNDPINIREEIARLNEIRKKNPVFMERGNLKFIESNNPSLLAYTRGFGQNKIMVIVNLNPEQMQEGMVELPDEWKGYSRVNVMDIYNLESYSWVDGRNYVRLTPEFKPVHILKRVLK